MKFLVILLTYSILIENSYAQVAANDKLKVCQKGIECECKVPNLAVRESFKLPPKYLPKEVISCDLLSFDLEQSINCLSPQKNKANLGCMIIKEDICKDPHRIPETYDASLKAKKNCGYKWQKIGVKRHQNRIKEWVEHNRLLCQNSMCVSAVHIALIGHAKAKLNNGKLTEKEFSEIIDPKSDFYKILAENAEPNELVEKYNLGTGHIVYLNKEKIDNVNSLAKGDIVQLWRKSHSGHSVVFKGLIDKDNDGKSDLFCYWSSQKRTNGFGNVCEPIKKISRLLIGHLK